MYKDIGQLGFKTVKETKVWFRNETNTNKTFAVLSLFFTSLLVWQLVWSHFHLISI